MDEKNTAQIRPVELGARHHGQRIVRKGVAAEDRVIVNGAKKVIPTMPVTIVPATAPAP